MYFQGNLEIFYLLIPRLRTKFGTFVPVVSSPIATLIINTKVLVFVSPTKYNHWSREMNEQLTCILCQQMKREREKESARSKTIISLVFNTTTIDESTGQREILIGDSHCHCNVELEICDWRWGCELL